MIDLAKITVKAGSGGAGMVAFAKRKGKIFGPPTGGDGGKGGDVYLVATKSMATLKGFQYNKIYNAKEGKMGGTNQKSGEAGTDLIIEVPAGTLVKYQDTDEVLVDMANTIEPVLVAKGGSGGQGNMHMRKFASHARRQIDWQMWQRAKEGSAGEELALVLELKLIADIGLIGLPNAGKSTLLSVLTSAKPRIADYPFTTLEPNLGVLSMNKKTYIIADIPGLIEGASQGKGLGKEFLRHIERTRVLVHLTQSYADYVVVRKELKEYGHDLTKKRELIVLSKIDILTIDEQQPIIDEFRSHKLSLIPISATTHDNLKGLTQQLENYCSSQDCENPEKTVK